MGQRKWFPKGKERTLTTNHYKYLMGIYSHEDYGDNCLRITKYKLDNTYIGHFVLVDGDWSVLGEVLLFATSNMNEEQIHSHMNSSKFILD